MLMDTKLRAVRTIIAITLLTVFFSQPIRSSDGESLMQLERSMSNLIYRASQSVVTVEASQPAHASVPPGAAEEALYSLVSTGVIIDTSNHILVVASTVLNRSQIAIRHGDRVVPATVVAIDYQNDLALLKCGEPIGSPADFSCNTGCAGQMLLSLGNSYGLSRTPSIGFCAGIRPDGLFQLTTPVTSGTIGSGVFSLTGELIGVVVSSIGQDNQSQMGLAVPAHRLRESVRYLLERGSRRAGYLGLTTAEIEITPPIEVYPVVQQASTGRHGLVIQKGVVITHVIPLSPAARAGLRTGDLLFSIDGKPITSALDLAQQVKASRPGSLVRLGVLRHNATLFVQATVGEYAHNQPEYADRLGFQLSSSSSQQLRDSLQVELNRVSRMLQDLQNQLNRLR